MARFNYSVIRRLGPLVTMKGLTGSPITMNLSDYPGYDCIKTGDAIQVTKGAFDFVESIEFKDMNVSDPRWIELHKQDDKV